MPRHPPKSDYELDSPIEWAADVAGFKQRRSPDGSVVTLVGVCWSCGDEMSVELAVRQRTGIRIRPWHQGLAPHALTGKDFVKVAYCNCIDKAHEDTRPANTDVGCGSYGAVRVGSTDILNGQPPRYVPVDVDKERVSVSDLVWERRADAEEPEALTTARKVAAQWTTTFASLAGLFGAVLVVKGPQDVSSVTGDLPTGLATASGLFLLVTTLALAIWYAWHATWSGGRKWPLVGLAAILLPGIAVSYGLLGVSDWGTATLVLLFGALCVAAAATLTGALAAYGMPSRWVAASGAVLRDRNERQRRHTRWYLAVSVVSAVVAFLLIGAALAVTYTHTASPSAAKLLVLSRDSEHPRACGVLKSSSTPGKLPDDQILVIDEGDDTQVAEIKVADVVSLAAVADCGPRD